MNIPYIPALNQPPIPNVGKTGFYVCRQRGGTIYRFPREIKLGDKTVNGQRLPHRSAKQILRALRSKYWPHEGAKQKAKKNKK